MFHTENGCFHPIEFNPSETLPEQFTFPFYYTPHPLCIAAADEVKTYLNTQTDFKHNFGLEDTEKGLEIGKMFGVMIVKTTEGQIGYISAFSGKLAESNHLKGFVPPVYDTLKKDGFYKPNEMHLNRLTADIERLEQNPELENAQLNLKHTKLKTIQELKDFKKKAKAEKQIRKQQRVEAEDKLTIKEKDVFFETLKHQSIQSNIDLKYLKLKLDSELEKAEHTLAELKQPIETLKLERKTLSASLQKQIHEQYRFLNARRDRKDLIDIFKATDLGQPPAAAGECAAPKLFQYAFENNLKPVAMAEFWWGISPNTEVRRHGQFYPSCRGRCEPILGHMMQGLDVEPNPIESAGVFKGELDIIYEDDVLLVLNKPHEFLSVPGKTIKDSVLTRIKTYLPEATGPLLLHRLDMSTSGLLVVAKNERTHKHLQKQFINRTVKKRYVAVLDGILDSTKGTIDLPLRVDLNNRPRQLVCYEHGKKATTNYEVVEVKDNKTRIHFYPISGRTHQLRVHAAHHKGLNSPIVGDDLYGMLANRLHLHAETLSFEHPKKREWVSFNCEAPF
ncbi:RluA family pseudouridine synthase [Winogradskyella thalassocola]|uniref:tRNA pseudouridine32 synthase / 23S rRNA pseudouridine746 synthase n=1 Tax=Winogradskyella thalassocola TaxID=262004 RepID=A0A1G8M1C2_9FLAO|nr:RluA family pseudouridine synthase [Winogradskyella thalassocola]SDI61180.1 tRNA pseudouridine32 synthase / 23S rRNA pseudouridine746 synthase [Winogradskyella thalassocola]